MTFKHQEIEDFIKKSIPSYQRDLLLESLNSNIETEEFYENIGKKLSGEITVNNILLNTGPQIIQKSFWGTVKDEVYLFICTDDKKYQKERLLSEKNFSQLVTIIATAIAGTLSLGAGVVVAIITNILISISKLSKNSWCELQKTKKETVNQA